MVWGIAWTLKGTTIKIINVLALGIVIPPLDGPGIKWTEVLHNPLLFKSTVYVSGATPYSKCRNKSTCTTRKVFFQFPVFLAVYDRVHVIVRRKT